MDTCIYLFICLCIYVCMYVWMYVCMDGWMDVFKYVYACTCILGVDVNVEVLYVICFNLKS